jgi:REP element-mobilizing transposase RayT
MRRYRIYSTETSFYYSTCTIIAWLPVFQEDKYFQVIIDSLKYCQDNKGLYLLGYVIMPSHLHLITDKWLNEKMNYMHANSVRKGFVIQPQHWKYSSLREIGFWMMIASFGLIKNVYSERAKSHKR